MKRGLMIALAFSFCGAVIVSPPIFALNTPTPVFGYHMSGGISNIYTYIDTQQTPAASY